MMYYTLLLIAIIIAVDSQSPEWANLNPHYCSSEENMQCCYAAETYATDRGEKKILLIKHSDSRISELQYDEDIVSDLCTKRCTDDNLRMEVDTAYIVCRFPNPNKQQHPDPECFFDFNTDCPIEFGIAQWHSCCSVTGKSARTIKPSMTSKEVSTTTRTSAKSTLKRTTKATSTPATQVETTKSKASSTTSAKPTTEESTTPQQRVTTRHTYWTSMFSRSTLPATKGNASYTISGNFDPNENYVCYARQDFYMFSVFVPILFLMIILMILILWKYTWLMGETDFHGNPIFPYVWRSEFEAANQIPRVYMNESGHPIHVNPAGLSVHINEAGQQIYMNEAGIPVFMNGPIAHMNPSNNQPILATKAGKQPKGAKRVQIVEKVKNGRVEKAKNRKGKRKMLKNSLVKKQKAKQNKK